MIAMMPTKIDRVNYGQLTFVDWILDPIIQHIYPIFANLIYTLIMSTLQKYNSIKPTNQSLDTFLTHED